MSTGSCAVVIDTLYYAMPCSWAIASIAIGGVVLIAAILAAVAH